MDLKRVFIEEFLRNLNKIDTLKEEVDLSNSDLTDAKKQMYWAMLSASLCVEMIKEFEPDINEKVRYEVGIDFSALYETLLKDKNTFNLDHAIIRDLVHKISDLKQFVEKLI